MTINTTDSIEVLNLPNRVANALRRSKILTVKDLLTYGQNDLGNVRNLGAYGVELVQSIFQRIIDAEIVVADLVDTGHCNSLKEIAPRNFMYIDGLYYHDVPLDELNLGARATNSFKSSGYLWFSQIFEMDTEDLSELANMGEKTIKEVKATLESIVLVLDDQAQEKGTMTPEFIANKVRLDLNVTMAIDLFEHHKEMIGFYREFLVEAGADYDWKNFLNDTVIQAKLRQVPYVNVKYQQFILESIRKSPYGLDLDEIIGITPAVLRDERYVKDNIQFLINNRKIRHLDARTLVQNGPSFITGARRHSSGLQYSILMKYVEGNPIESIASELGYSSRWVVSNIKKLLGSIRDADRDFAEDVYLELMRNYDISYEQFTKVVKDPRIFHYLDLSCRYGARKYKKNRMPLDEMIKDNDIPYFFKGLFAPLL